MKTLFHRFILEKIIKIKNNNKIIPNKPNSTQF